MKSSMKLAKASVWRHWLAGVVAALALACGAPFSRSAPAEQTIPIPVKPSDPWQTNQLIDPDQLANSLAATNGEKPLVICVGFSVLYQGGHIAGAKFAGPGSRPEGIQTLKRAVRGVPPDKKIVLYCGCCPWEKCPNIRAAFRAMQEWGFKDVEALYVPTNLRKDWIAKGFPTEKGAEAK